MPAWRGVLSMVAVIAAGLLVSPILLRVLIWWWDVWMPLHQACVRAS